MDTQYSDGVKIVAAAAHLCVSIAVTEDGTLYSWGQARTYAPHDAQTLYGTVDRPTGLGHSNMDDKLVPTRVAPQHMQGNRIGRCRRRLPPEHALAFAMGTHTRLGSAQPNNPAPAAGAHMGKGCAQTSILDDEQEEEMEEDQEDLRETSRKRKRT